MAPDSLQQQLKTLLELQIVDERIAKLTSQRETLVRRRKQVDAAQKQHDDALAAKQHAHQAAQVEQRSKATELRGLQDRLAKYEEQQRNARDANEYTALTSQIATTTKVIDAMEEQAIAAMLGVDEAAEALEQERQTCEQERSTANAERARLDGTAQKLDAELNKTRAARDARAQLVPAKLLSDYATWRERRGMTMVARLIGDTCEGCHLSLPPQKALEIRRWDRIYTCPACYRILFPIDEILPDASDSSSNPPQ
ncbi:hypothetical protein FJZ36_12810 [Candidatus Poribacteria bacterium]|nr:hypothetical protein [Candidatus Poribacteria bacterium]